MTGDVAVDHGQQHRADMGAFYEAGRAMAQHAPLAFPNPIPGWDELDEQEQFMFSLRVTHETAFIAAEIIKTSQPEDVLLDLALSQLNGTGVDEPPC